MNFITEISLLNLSVMFQRWERDIQLTKEFSPTAPWLLEYSYLAIFRCGPMKKIR